MVRSKSIGRKSKATGHREIAASQEHRLEDLRTPQQAAELAAMLRMLEVSEGRFSLSIAVCNSPALRDYLIQRLRESRPGIEVIDLSDADSVTDLMSHIRDNSPAAPSALMLIGMETSLSSAEVNHPILQSLNASREQLEKRNHWPVVIWLPEYAAEPTALHLEREHDD